VTLVLPSLRPPPPPRPGLARRLRRLALMAVGFLIIVLGILIAPLPGPGGVPVIALGLVIVLRNSWWAKRQFIRAQRARPKWVYPFRRLMRKKPEIAPVRLLAADPARRKDGAASPPPPPGAVPSSPAPGLARVPAIKAKLRQTR